MWVVGSGNHVAWLGLYEYRKQRIFARLIQSGSVVYDVGAHAGFYTLLASRLVGGNGTVVAFEPLPRNVEFLRKHVLLNRCANVEIIEAAVSDTEGRLAFQEHESSYMGGLTPQGNIQVTSVCLDALTESGRIPPPTYVKIDVEGGEEKVLKGASGVLERDRPMLFLATHGREVHARCVRLLQERGYNVRPLAGKDLWQTDELIAWYPLAAKTQSPD